MDAEELQKVEMDSDERCYHLRQDSYEEAGKQILSTPIEHKTALLLPLQ